MIKCQKEGLDWTVYGIPFEELDPAETRDSLEHVEDAQSAIEDKYWWYGIGPEGPAIQEVIESIDSDDVFAGYRAWRAHLTDVLSLPFDAVVNEWQDRGPLRAGDKVKACRSWMS